MTLVTLSLFAYALLGAPSYAATPEYEPTVYGELRGGAYDLLRLIGRESNQHLNPPVVILTGECAALTTLLANDTDRDEDVFNFVFANNDGIFEMKATEFFKKNPAGTLMLRGRPSTFKMGAFIANRYYKDEHDVSKYAIVYQANPSDEFVPGLLVNDLLRHAYGGLAKGCHYYVVPGLTVRAHLRFASECQAALLSKAKSASAARA